MASDFSVSWKVDDGYVNNGPLTTRLREGPYWVSKHGVHIGWYTPDCEFPWRLDGTDVRYRVTAVTPLEPIPTRDELRELREKAGKWDRHCLTQREGTHTLSLSYKNHVGCDSCSATYSRETHRQFQACPNCAPRKATP